MEQKIGITAGQIWNELEKKGEHSPKTLQTALNERTETIFLALGWLAREGKVNFTPTKSSFKVTINSENK